MIIFVIVTFSYHVYCHVTKTNGAQILVLINHNKWMLLSHHLCISRYPNNAQHGIKSLAIYRSNNDNTLIKPICIKFLIMLPKLDAMQL